jgi:hypothetical protein
MLPEELLLYFKVYIKIKKKGLYSFYSQEMLENPGTYLT